jgi:predicted O-methyltransferase YrrM
MTALPIVRVNNDWPNVPSHNYTGPNEVGIIMTMLDSIRPRRMIEFGTNEGRTTRQILNGIKSVEYYLGVDVPFSHQMPITGQQSEVPRQPAHLVADDPRFELVLRFSGKSDEELFAGRASFDAAFIDGDHSYAGVMTDYRLARRLVRKGGLILFHDYTNPTVDVTKALEDLYQNEHRGLSHISGTWLAFEFL